MALIACLNGGGSDFIESGKCITAVWGASSTVDVAEINISSLSSLVMYANGFSVVSMNCDNVQSLTPTFDAGAVKGSYAKIAGGVVTTGTITNGTSISLNDCDYAEFYLKNTAATTAGVSFTIS